ncbi:hypothetical protein BDZ91DRAFT_709273, partial [Kalaharituber pfeilii]
MAISFFIFPSSTVALSNSISSTCPSATSITFTTSSSPAAGAAAASPDAVAAPGWPCCAPSGACCLGLSRVPARAAWRRAWDMG